MSTVFRRYRELPENVHTVLDGLSPVCVWVEVTSPSFLLGPKPCRKVHTHEAIRLFQCQTIYNTHLQLGQENGTSKKPKRWFSQGPEPTHTHAETREQRWFERKWTEGTVLAI